MSSWEIYFICLFLIPLFPFLILKLVFTFDVLDLPIHQVSILFLWCASFYSEFWTIQVFYLILIQVLTIPYSSISTELLTWKLLGCICHNPLQISYKFALLVFQLLQDFTQWVSALRILIDFLLKAVGNFWCVIPGLVAYETVRPPSTIAVLYVVEYGSWCGRRLAILQALRSHHLTQEPRRSNSFMWASVNLVLSLPTTKVQGTQMSTTQNFFSGFIIFHFPSKAFSQTGI